MRHFVTALRAAALSIACLCLLAAPALAQSYVYRSDLTLRVGQSIMVYGAGSPNCARNQAPDWDAVARRLPRTDLGYFSNGGVVQLASSRCGGRIAGRGIVFTATRAGRAVLNLQGDRVTVTVRN
ncbi:hypothetical protein [Frigidibacter oleivorans]|uniref:hypothetical protein n=1 Tax=Frigidibacter oleivorans TaxID=2487129 RepID=UPI000F8F23D4|nr:hypothetical protein [Frigidibacter oleivorans]